MLALDWHQKVYDDIFLRGRRSKEGQTTKNFKYKINVNMLILDRHPKLSTVTSLSNLRFRGQRSKEGHFYFKQFFDKQHTAKFINHFPMPLVLFPQKHFVNRKKIVPYNILVKTRGWKWKHRWYYSALFIYTVLWSVLPCYKVFQFLLFIVTQGKIFFF